MNILHNFPESFNIALIGASGGIGTAMLDHIASQQNTGHIYAFSRNNIASQHNNVSYHSIDVTSEDSIIEVASTIQHPLHLILVTIGLLHNEDDLFPEKSLKDLSAKKFEEIFAVNTIGPALIAKHFLPHIPKKERSVFASLSARVVSVSDNRIGGWYSYRASKAALNMIIKNAAIETGRRYKQACIVGLHPGTVDTALSKPFQAAVPDKQLFTPAYAAEQLLHVINSLTPEDSGACFAWDGQKIVP